MAFILLLFHYKNRIGSQSGVKLCTILASTTYQALRHPFFMLLAIECIVGYFALFLGGMGLAGFFGPLLQPYVSGVLAVGVFGLPSLLLYVATFARAMLPTSTYRRVWLFAACWYAVLAVAAEICYARGYMPPESPAYARALSRAMLHVGWLSFVPIVHTCVIEFRHHRLPRA